MCDCFHLAFPNWHAASSGTAGRRLRGPEPGTEDDSVCDEPSQFTEGERPRPQGSSPVEEYPEKYTDSDKECEAEHDPHHKSGGGKKTKKSGLGSMFEKRSTPKMNKLKEVHSPESEVIVKTAADGCAEGLVYGGGGKEGIFIKGVVPESPASKSLQLKEGDQILSATVYFDNVPYEDAIQILEHAQAYKLKLCLKRKPDITETEAAMESDIIPEEELCAPEMREQGKTKRRGDARISWPKFPSFGKGRKTRFTRSHSSSEADEQRKLELSPTTSDTESPIKSQDALKGKKRHKMKLSLLTKRSRISSSEDTDAPTNGQTSSDVYQTASDMLSHECLESLSGETPKVYVSEELRLDQDDLTEPQTARHKVELISVDSTLKTADLTVALADQGSPSGIKSPGEKKKKKERSELKMKILGKDKSHKKDAKAKASPKRLKTLGASIEKADQPINGKSDSHTNLQRDQPPLEANTQMISSEASRAKLVTTQMEMNVPKVELDISDVSFMRKSHQKVEEQAKKDKETKQKKETKTCPTFKLPKIGLGEIATEETIQTSVNVELPTKMEVEGKAVKDDPYDRLSKSSHSKTQLPKREDIEIPGMEDMSVKIKAKGIKGPKVVSTGHYEEIQTEAVQMSIDVDSVKEAVSKLPGFKLPKVDTSGMPIPEEITVIDANAQRISVKTPTKVADTKSKHEAHLIKFDITPADLISEELLIETKVDYKKPEKIYITTKQSDHETQSEVHKREDIIIPGKESVKKDLGFKLPQQNISGQEDSVVLGERTILLQNITTSKTETRKGKGQIGGVTYDVKIPEIDSIEYIDSVGGSPAKMGGGVSLTGFAVQLDATKPKADISFPDIRGEDKDVGPEEHPTKLVKFAAVAPSFSVKVPDVDKNINIDGAEIEVLQRKGEESKYKIPNLGVTLGSVDVAITEKKVKVEKPAVEIKPLQTDIDGEGRKFKMPKVGVKMPKIKGPEFDLSSSKKDIYVTLPEAKAGVKLPDSPEVDVTLGGAAVSIPEQKVKVEKPEVEIKSLLTEVEVDGQGSKFKMPKFGIKMPKIKGPEFDLSSSKKDIDVKLPEAPEVDVTLGGVDVSIPEQKVKVEKPEVEIKPLQTDVALDGEGSKFKMPKFGIKMPKIKGPEFDLSSSKKEVDVKLPEAPEVDVTLGGVDVSIPEQKVEVEKPAVEIKPLQTEVELDGEGSKFKMPKFGIKMPKIKGPEFDLSSSKKEVDVKLPEAKVGVKLPEAPECDITLGNIDVSIPEQKVEVQKPEVEIKPLQTDVALDGEGSKFKMPKFGIKMPKIKGPEFDLSSSKKEVDVKLPEAPEVDVTLGGVDVSIPEQTLLIEKPAVEIKPLQTDVDLDGEGSKFKMPKFGIKMPKIKGPEFDLSSSKKDMYVTLPEAKAGVKLPDSPEVNVTLGGAAVSISEQKVKVEKPEVEIKSLLTEVEVDGQGSKFKMPKFGIKMPKIKGPEFDLSSSKKEVDVKLPEAPEVDVTLGGVDVSIPEQKVEVEKPELEIKPLQTDVDLDGQGSKFKMPKFGIKMPKIKGPEFDLSLSKKDIDVTLPEAKAGVTQPEVKAGVKLPEAPAVDVTLGGVDVSIQEQKLEVEKPEVEIKSLLTEVELDRQGSKFKMPKFGIKMPKIKGPEFDLSLSKKEVDVKLPEAPAVDVTLGGVDVSIPEQKVEVDKPEVEIKPRQTEVDLDGEGSKFKMPKFGMSMPKVKGPEFQLGLSKKDVDVTLPEAKAEVSLPDVELKEPSAKVDIKAPEIKVAAKDTSGSPSRFKMPTFSFSKPKVKVPDIDLNVSKKDTDITSTVKLPEAPKVDVSLGKAEVLIPEATVEAKKPEVQIKPLHAEVELDGHGSRFKMPKFGITMPKVKGPDIDLSFSKKDVDVKSPEAEFKLPEAPEIDVKLGKAEVSIPDVKMEVDKPELEMQPLETHVELDGHGSRFKMPKFGISMPKVKGPDIDFSLSKKDVDVTLPEAKAEIELPDVELKDPSAKVEIKASETEAQVEGSPSKFKLPTFKLPKFGTAAPSVTMEVPDMDKDKATVDIAAQNINIEGPSLDVKMTATDGEGKESKFKVPGFGISLPKVQGPKIDLSLSKKDVDVKSPEAEFKLPETPEMDVKLGKAEVSIPDVKMEVDKPELKIKPLETHVELDGHGSRFKMPKFGISMPKVKGPEIDFSLSKKDVDVTLPEAKAEVSLPDVELREPSAKVDIKAPEIKVAAKDTSGSPSRFKMPTFSFSKPKVKVPDIDLNVSKKDTDITSTVKLPEAPKVDVSLGKAEVLIPEATVEAKKPEVQIKPLHAEVELDGHGSRFKMPKFGITMPKVKGPDIDLSFSKKDVDVKSPEAEFKLPEAPEIDVKLGKAEVSIPDVKMEVDKPELEMQPLETHVELDGHGSRFKMPKFGISMPKVKGPEIDFSLSKKDVDVTLPEAKAEVSLPDVELKEPSAKVDIKAPEIKVAAKDTSGSPSRFKMPTFSFSKPKVKVPDIDLNVSKKDTDITSTVKLPEAPKVDVSLGKAEVLIPEATVEAKKPEVQIKPLHAEVELDGHGSRFKMPNFGITMPKVKGPDIDLSFSKKDVDVKSPEAEFKLPEAPEIDVKLGKAEVSIPDVKMEVDKPELEIKPLETHVELDGHGSRFKMPKFGISMPKVKGPDIDFSLSKKDVDVTLPEAKAEIELPDVELKDPSAKVEIKASETEAQVEGSPSKFKLPTFKLPKFGIAAPSVTMEVPDMDKDKATVDIAAQNINIEGPSLDVKMTATDGEGKESKFKVPGFGISLPKVQGPKIDLSLSKKDVDVKSPEAEFKLPETPEMDVKLGKAEVSIPDVKMEVDKPELKIKPLETQVELDGHGSRFKMPKFGISMPKVKGPDIDFSLSKKDVDVTLPEAKAEVSLPDVELKEPSAKVDIKAPEIKVAAKDTSGSPSRFKMPTFSFSKPKVKVPDIDLNVSKKDTDITSTVKLPEAPKVDVSLGKAEVLIPEATVEAKKPEVQIKPLHAEVELDGHGSRFKMPKFGITMPKVKGPDIDLSFSKKDVDVKSPEAEFKLPEAPEMDVKLGKAEVLIPDVKMEVDKPELEMQPLETHVELDGHGSRFKMPKFGISMPKVKGPEIDLSLSKKDVDVTLPEAKAEVSLPDVELQESSTKVEVKGPEVEAQLGSMKGSPSKFKLPTFKFPKFGVTTPNVSTEVSDTEHKIKIDGADISVPNTDVEVKGEVSLPEVEVKEPSGGVVIEQPGVEVDAKMKKPKFSLPRFSFSKSSVNAPEVDVSVQNVNVELPEGKVEVKGGEVDMKPPEEEAEIDRQGSKFKMPKFGISLPKVTGPEIDLSLSNKDVDVKIPEAKAEVKLPDVDLKEPSAEVEIKPPEIKVVTKDTEGSPSKFKMPTFKLPKFGIGSPSSTIEVPDMDTDVKINGGDIEIPEKVVAVDISAPSIDTEGPSIDLKTTAAEREGKGSKFKLPSLSFSVPQVKSPDIDLSLSKTSVDVRLPEAKADVQLPEAQVKEPSAKVEIKSPGIEVHTSNVEGSPSKFKMPTFKLPKFGTSTTQISVEVPDVDKDIKVDGEDLKLPEAKAEVKLPDVEIKEPVQSSISVSQAPMAEGDAKVKKTSWTLPRFSFPKTNIKSPEAEVNLDTPKVDVSLPEVKAEVRLPDVDKESSSISVEGAANIDLDAKLKKPKFSLPKFSFSKQSSKELEVDASLPEVDVSLPEGNVGVAPSEVDVKPPEGDVKLDGQESKFKMPKFGISMPKVKGPDIDLSLSKKDVGVIQPKAEVEIPEGPKLDVDVKPSECEAEIDGQGGKFKMPKFGISMPKVKGPEIDFSLSKKDVDVTLPEAEAEVQLPDVKIKQPSAKVEIKAAEIKAGNVEGSPSKLKMPTFTLPKFGASTPKVSVQVPDVDKDIQIDDAKLEVLKEGAMVTVTAPSIEAEGLSVKMKAKAGELEGSESKFKMPHIGITVPKVKGPEIDLSLSKKCPDVTLPEGKVEVTLPSAEVIEPEGAVETVETEAKSKRPNWTFPKFSFSRTSGKAPDVDVNLETPKADVASPEVEAEVCLPHVKEPSGNISVEEPPAVELDGNLKKSKFSLPKFSFSKSSVTMPEISAEPPQVDVSLPEGEVIVKQPEMEMKAPELEDQLNVQGSKFKFPKFGIALPKAEGHEVDLNASQKDVEVTLPNVKAEVKLPEVEVKASSSNVEADAKKTDVGGSPLKFKMPTMKMPKFGGASYDVTVEAPDVDKAEKDAAKLEDVTVEIKAPSVDIKTEPKAVITDSETPKTETDGVSHGSPSRFKLPTFKMPKLSFSKSKPEEEHGDSDGQEDQPEREEETKSPKLTLTSFGEILKNIDVEFDVSKTEEENLKASKEVHETSEPSGKELDAKEKETTTKLDTPKSPERTGWFKFPKFGLSSPSESAKMPEKDEHKDGKTPETGDEEISPTCSVQSSDAFADISSTMTSEHVGLSISSPTKVTVKYSDPDAAPSLEEMHSSVITSTTRTELISVEPNLPEKITILSSGVSSSSEDTLRLESGKIHVITSNIQATPDSQHAKLLTAVQVQSAGGPPLQSEGEEAASWTVEDPQGGKRTVFERHIVRGTSSERSESKETIVITKQITRIFDSTEPISGETATSIQRLRDSVHSEKMRFFDGAEK